MAKLQILSLVLALSISGVLSRRVEEQTALSVEAPRQLTAEWALVSTSIPVYQGAGAKLSICVGTVQPRR